MDVNFLLSLTINGVVVGSIYSLISLAVVLIYKCSKVLNLAQGELVMLGAYSCYAVIVSSGLPVSLAVLLTLLGMGAAGLLIERILLRPMIGESFIAVIMITLGLGQILHGVVALIWGSATYAYPRGNLRWLAFSLSGIEVSEVYVVALSLCFILCIGFFLFFKYSILGVAIRATASDQIATMSMGISISKIFAVTWSLAAILSGIVGGLIGYMSGLNLTLSSYGLLALGPVLLGGLDSVGGCILASFMVGIMESLCQGYLSSLAGGSVSEITAFLVILATLLIRPYGLFGTAEIERV